MSEIDSYYPYSYNIENTFLMVAKEIQIQMKYLLRQYVISDAEKV